MKNENREKRGTFRINEIKSIDWSCAVDMEGAGQGVGESAAFFSVGLGDQSGCHVGKCCAAGYEVGDTGSHFVCGEVDY